MSLHEVLMHQILCRELRQETQNGGKIYSGPRFRLSLESIEISSCVIPFLVPCFQVSPCLRIYVCVTKGGRVWVGGMAPSGQQNASDLVSETQVRVIPPQGWEVF